jgi:REP element-mobilizing transposase RayT
MRQHPQTYAITAITHNRRRLFQRAETADRFIATLFRYRDAHRFLLHAFVVMPDHIHTILTPATDVTIERCVQLIKGGFSLQYGRTSTARSGRKVTTPTASRTTKISAINSNTF